MRLTHSLKRTCGVPSPGPISPASHINLHGYLSAIPGTTEIGAKSFLEFYNRSASCPSVSSSGENTQFILAHTTSGKVCNLQHYSPSSPTYNRAKNNNAVAGVPTRLRCIVPKGEADYVFAPE